MRGLELSGMDKAAGPLHIQGTLKHVIGRGFSKDAPKAAIFKRDISLTKDMITILGRQKQLYGEKVLKMDGYIFHLPDGSLINEKRVQSGIDHVMKHISVDDTMFERFTLYCSRHTFVIRVIEDGMKPQALKTILGHVSLLMAMDLYPHVLPTIKAEEMKLIAKAP